jgi:hypothetical protein
MYAITISHNQSTRMTQILVHDELVHFYQCQQVYIHQICTICIKRVCFPYKNTVVHHKVYLCTMQIQQKPTTWLWSFSKHRSFQQINGQIYISLWQLVLIYIKSGKMHLHLVHNDMYSFVIWHWHSCSWYSSYTAIVAKPITLHSAENQIIFPPVLLIFTILSMVSNKSLVS